MKTSDIKVNTLISFNYKKTHPRKDRLFYVTKVDSTSITGVEFSDMNSTKKFLLSYITNLALVPSAKLPIEAEDYADEIFANIFKEDKENIRMEEVCGELVGYVKIPKNVTGVLGIYSLDFKYNGKTVQLMVDSNGINEYNYPNKELRTPQELAQYILTNLS